MTDGTEHPGGVAATPGQDSQSAPPIQGPQAPQTPQGPAIPGQFAPQPPAAPTAYGYPPQGGYGYPQPGYQQPSFQQAQFGAGSQPFGQAPGEPDWAALADDNEARSRRRKWAWTGGIVLAACVLGGIVGIAVVNSVHDKGKSVAKGSPSASSSAAANSPTVPGQPSLLADHSGQANVAISPDAQVDPVQGGHALRLRSNPNSYAQSADPLVDVSKSFTISAWVYNEAPGGARTAISEGDGISYSFDLGRDDSNGHKAWAFRVQTADGGADGTAVQALAPETMDTVGQWVLLTGAYDSSQHTITLFVNGTQAATAQVPAIWSGPGPLQLGRTRHHGIWGGYWAGVIAHIQIFNQPLTASQVGTLKGGGTLDTKPIDSWLVG